MGSKLKKILLSFLLICLCLVFGQKVDAQSINYHTYKYGTTQTSMADGYYARPASVVADGKEYLVTMTIRTKKSLSPYPVEVLTIDGQAPLNVVKVRHGSDYDYRYSFRTNNLDRMISSKIRIDVPHVYKATHNISFRFDTKNLPKLTGKKAHVKVMQAPKSNTKNNNQNSDNSALLTQAKQQSREVKQKEDALARQKLAQNRKDRQANEHNQRMFYYLILGGSICILILLVAAVFFVLSAKTAKHSKDK